jgi:hypothetical protein
MGAYWWYCACQRALVRHVDMKFLSILENSLVAGSHSGWERSLPHSLKECLGREEFENLDDSELRLCWRELRRVHTSYSHCRWPVSRQYQTEKLRGCQVRMTTFQCCSRRKWNSPDGVYCSFGARILERPWSILVWTCRSLGRDCS